MDRRWLSYSIMRTKIFEDRGKLLSCQIERIAVYHGDSSNLREAFRHYKINSISV